MSPELNRSGDRGGELAISGQAAQPAAGREAGQHQPADDTGQPADDTGRPPDDTGQPADDKSRGMHESAPGIDETGAEAEDTGLTAHRGGQAIGPAADRAEGALLADAAGLHAGWRRIQAGFVDDPREAVADAADLVEHAAQAFVGALQQRQRRLRGIWNGDERPDGAAEQITDTEQLRLVMQRYRSLFDQICRP
jgi:hypothetical protein